jgi:hypothetical protein
MSYTDKVSPKDVQEAVNRGFERLANFRNARLLFLRNYAGQYYDRSTGEIGSEPLNLIFNAIRILVPNIVLSFPKHSVVTPYLQAKAYADLLGLALDTHDKQINIRDIYRRVIVDAIFTLGIMKTGLAQSQSIYAIDDEDSIDTGTIYTEAVDFDNFVVDPNCKEHLFRDAAFIGDRITLPRRMLLDSPLYNTELVEKLPRAGSPNPDRAYELSMRNIQREENAELEDQVEVCEIWVPSANAIVTVPGSKDVQFDDYLRIDDYYGVEEGPYTFLTLTPPVPGNPLPVPSVGIWNDLHVLANRMAKKIVEQAERQKDIIFYKRTAADDAASAKDAGDGEAVAADDPDGIRVQSFGGQQNSNEVHLAQLQGWFNMMAGNPNQIGGQGIDAKTATSAQLLQQNAGIGLEDMKDLVYQAAAAEARHRAWYLHTDPLIQMPLTQRQSQPAQFGMGPAGPVMLAPPTMAEVQVVLTPDARSGKFIDFTFEIQPESMGRRDSRTRFAQALDFATKIMPASLTAAQIAVQLGIPFSAKAFILRMAKDAGIDWMDEVFYDPEFQQQLQMMQMMGPQAGPSKGQAAPQQPQPLQSNGQPANLPFNAPPDMQDRQQQQAGAQEGQRLVQREVSRAMFAPNPIPAYG